MSVRVTLPPTTHRAEIFIVIGHERAGRYMFWHGVDVDPEVTDVDAVEEKLSTYRKLDGYHYERFGNVFQLPPAYKFTPIQTLEES